jgi:hypothetical protein
MYEDLEARVALLAATLPHEEYERFGPAIQELGLAIAEFRHVERDVQRVRGAYGQAMEDLDRAEERVHNAIRLWDDAE